MAKQDLIEELKKSKDITGIKKMKVEKVKMEEQHEKELVTEIVKQLSVESFVEKVIISSKSINIVVFLTFTVFI